MTVRMAAQVDDLSNGRLILGMGAGWQEREHTKFDVPFYDVATRFAMLTDAMEITTRLLDSNEHVTYEGKHFSLNDAILLPRPKRRTPILVGGNGTFAHTGFRCPLRQRVERRVSNSSRF